MDTHINVEYQNYLQTSSINRDYINNDFFGAGHSQYYNVENAAEQHVLQNVSYGMNTNHENELRDKENEIRCDENQNWNIHENGRIIDQNGIIIDQNGIPCNDNPSWNIHEYSKYGKYENSSEMEINNMYNDSRNDIHKKNTHDIPDAALMHINYDENSSYYENSALNYMSHNYYGVKTESYNNDGIDYTNDCYISNVEDNFYANNYDLYGNKPKEFVQDSIYDNGELSENEKHNVQQYFENEDDSTRNISNIATMQPENAYDFPQMKSIKNVKQAKTMKPKIARKMREKKILCFPRIYWSQKGGGGSRKEGTSRFRVLYTCGTTHARKEATFSTSTYKSKSLAYEAAKGFAESLKNDMVVDDYSAYTDYGENLCNLFPQEIKYTTPLKN